MHKPKKWYVPLSTSLDFKRLITLVYGFVLLILWQSEWQWVEKILMILLLGLQMLVIHRCCYIPYPHYQALEYTGRAWFLHHTSGEIEDFLEGRLVMSCGLFFLLKLKNGIHSKTLIIFLDQVPKKFFRFLRLSQQCQINRWF